MKKATFYKTVSDGQEVIGTIDENGVTTGIGKFIKKNGYRHRGESTEWAYPASTFFTDLEKAFSGSYLRAKVEEV